MQQLHLQVGGNKAQAAGQCRQAERGMGTSKGRQAAGNPTHRYKEEMLKRQIQGQGRKAARQG